MLRISHMQRDNLRTNGYFAFNGMDSPGIIHKRLYIDGRARGRAMDRLIFHTKMSNRCPKTKGFIKMYVNDILYNHYEGRTGYGENIIINLEFIIVGLVDGSMKYMENIQRKLSIAIDNLFRTNKKEKTFEINSKLIILALIVGRQ